MTADPKRICATCDLWVRNEPNTSGECRRYPPTVLGQVSFDGSGANWWDFANPYTAPDHFCGEHRHDR